MFLSQQEIEERSQEFFPHYGKYDPELLNQASYDLRVGDEVFLSEKSLPIQLSENNPYVVLHPGQFALIKTYEWVKIPRDIVAFISIRSKLKLQGLINISGFHVDPTYEGYLIFSVQNVGPNDIRLKYKDATFMIMWARLSKPYNGDNVREQGYERITLELMSGLGGPAVNLLNLKKQVDNISLLVRIYGSLVVAAFIAILVFVLRGII